jgi:hypothetical protein
MEGIRIFSGTLASFSPLFFSLVLEGDVFRPLKLEGLKTSISGPQYLGFRWRLTVSKWRDVSLGIKYFPGSKLVLDCETGDGDDGGAHSQGF